MERNANSGLFGGLILLIGGILALVGQFVPDAIGEFFGSFLLLGLGLVFLAVGIYTREGGWFIPGGILSGLGAGIALLNSSWIARLPGDEGGWFMLAFAAGWLLIPIMTAVFADETHWWALIPAGIIGLVALAVLFGGAFANLLEWVGKLWPLALIAAGGLLLWKARRPATLDDQKAAKHV